MDKFVLTPKMLTIGGVFYPMGYAFIMFPDTESAEQAAREVESKPGTTGPVMLLSPTTVLKEIGNVGGALDVTTPAVSAEVASVRKFVELARQGHAALVVKLGSDADAELVMIAARKAAFSHGQRYHLLEMEAMA